MKTEVISGALRARLSNVDRAELEQAYLRVLMAAAIVVYLACFAKATHSIGASTLLFVVAYFAAALVIVLTIWAWPIKSMARRILGIVVDVAMATWGLWALGESGVVIVGIYLFIILGNGFRYGRMYLHISQVASLIGFAIVMVSSPWWSAHVAIGAGLLQILLIIPFYVSKLAERLKAALRNSQQALEECRRENSERSSEASRGYPS